jgi:hypothetical protein
VGRVPLETFQLKPSKPMGIAKILAAIAILTFGTIVSLSWDNGNRAFFFLWLGCGLVIIALTAWTIFFRNGSFGTLRPSRNEEEADRQRTARRKSR